MNATNLLPSNFIPLGQRFRYQVWVWIAILASILVCGLIAGLHFYQQNTLNNMAQAMTTMHLARINLAKGFLYATLAETPGTPFNRDEGLVLLQQASDSFQEALLTHPDFTDAELLTAFQDSLQIFTDQLDEYRAATEPLPKMATDLRIAFHNLERQADLVDEQSQQRLEDLSAQMNSEFGLTLAGSAILLMGMCFWMIYIGREKERADAALQRSEKDFRLVIERTPVGLAILSEADNSVVFVNERFKTTFGYTRTDIPNIQTWWELAYPDAAYRHWAMETWNQAVQKANLENTDVAPMQLNVTCKNGEIRIVEISGVIIGQNFLVMFSDITAHKRAEETLRNSEEQYRLLFETANDGIVLHGLSTDPSLNRFRRFNQNICKMLGYTAEEMAQLGPMDIQPPEEMSNVPAEAEQMAEHGNLRFEKILTRKDGTLIPTEVHSSTFELNGETMVLSIIQDITERKQAEEALKLDSEMMKHMAEGVALTRTQDGVIVQVNDHFAQMFGYTSEELIGKHVSTLNALRSDKTPQEVSHEIASAIQKVGEWHGEIFNLKKDGTPFWCQVNISMFEHHQHGKVQVSARRDITAHKYAEDERRKLAERLDLATSAAHMGIWDWDIQKNELVWDKQMYFLYGLHSGEFGGAYEFWVQGLHPEDRQASDEISTQALRGERPYDTEFRVMWPDGSVHWLKANGEVFRDKSGAPIRMIGVNYDITQQKLAEATLLESETRFRALFENAIEAVLMSQPDGRILAVNPAAKKLFNLSEQEFLATDRQSIVDEKDPRISQLLQERQETGKMHGELTFVRGDGTKFEGEVTSSIYLDKYGHPKTNLVIRDITIRKQMEEALQTANRRFQMILEGLYGGILVLNNDNYVEFANQAFCELFDLADLPNAILGLHASDILELIKNVYADPPQALSRIREIVTHMQPIQDEEIAISGARTYLRDFIPLEIEGHLSGRLWHHLDITERKRAEQELRESRELFQMLFNLSPVAYSLSQNGMIVDINPACEEIFEHSKAEIIGKRVVDVDFWVDQNELQKATEIFKNNGELRDFEFAYKTKTGSTGWAISYANLIYQGEEQYVLSEFVNITDRKHLENELRLNEERLKLALRPSYMVLAQTDEAARYTWIYNPHPDFDTNFVIGKTDLELSNNEGTKKLYEVKRQVIQTGRGLQLEIAFPVSDGLHSYEFVIEPRHNVSGQIIGATTSAYDITERKKNEDELRRSNAELEQFAYVASHDLQEPLRAVAGMVQLLQQRYQGQLDDRADEYIQHAVDAANRMRTLINDLLDYSRIDRRGQPFAPVNTTHAVSAALKNLDVSIMETKAHVTWDPLPTIKADGGQLIQLFQNLIGNSIKFRSTEPPHIHIQAESVPGAWHFTVRDNGIGIDPQYFERIFLLFQRLHTRSEFPGTGIGLALCKKIVERHRGKIWVESRPNEGATFHFTLSSEEIP